MNKTQTKNKRITIIIIAIIIIIVATIVAKNALTSKSESIEEEETTTEYVEEIEAGVKLNVSTGINEIRTVDGLEFSNIQLTSTGGMTSFIADVKNVSGVKMELTTVKVILYDEEGEVLATLPGVVNELEADETTQFNVGSTANFVDAYDLEIVVE